VTFPQDAWSDPPGPSMTLVDWHRYCRRIEHGDTGRNVYTDERVSYAVFEDKHGTRYYVEYDELDEKQQHTDRARKVGGTLVVKKDRACWVDADTGATLAVCKEQRWRHQLP
jgi:hypothetical protein